MQKGSQLALVFHTAFNEEFSGESPEDIVMALHKNSQKGMGDISFEDWWKYQQKMWGIKYGIEIPDPDQPHSHEKLLDVLTKVGALEKGALPQSDTSSRDHGAPDVG